MTKELTNMEMKTSNMRKKSIKSKAVRKKAAVSFLSIVLAVFVTTSATPTLVFGAEENSAEVNAPWGHESEENMSEDSAIEESAKEIEEGDTQSSKMLSSEALRAFDDICRDGYIGALTFHSDNLNPEGTDVYLESGSYVFVKGVKMDRGVLKYLIQPVVTSENMSQEDMPCGYVDSYYIATEDERLLSWEQEYAADSLNIVGAGNGALIGGEYSPNGEYSSSSAYGLNGEYGAYAEYRANDSGVSDFPQVYQKSLKELSAKHPNWKFVVYRTGLKWSEAVSNELSGDRSWIEGSADSKYVNKSKPKGGAWYLATKEGVEYYMNPLTSLNEKNIFMHESMAFNSSYQTEDAVKKLLAGTFMSGKIPGSEQTYANAFYEIGQSSAVKASPLFLAARVKQEQGAGASGLISGTYPGYVGYYNYFNIQATGTGDAAIRNGLAYAKSKGWDSRYKSLKGGASYTAEGYIQKGQNTLYLQKFNFAYKPYYNHQYMQNIRAPYGESTTLYNGYKNAGVLDRAFVFRIPVFTDGVPSKDDREYTKGSTNVAAGYQGVRFVDGTLTRELSSVYYTGTTITPDVEVYVDGVLLRKNKDYSVKYTNNKKVTEGTGKQATIKVTCKGNYKGVMYAYFDIVDNGAKSFFDATKIKSISSLKSVTDYTPFVPNQFFTQSGYEAKSSTGAVLEEGVDYIVNYANNSTAGKASMIVLGINDYKGVVKKTFDIRPYTISLSDPYIGMSVSGNDIKGQSMAELVYQKGGVKPDVLITLSGNKLVCGADYTIKYTDNKNAGTGHMIITGKGQFTGQVTRSFKIERKDIKSSEVIPLFKATTASGKKGNGLAKVDLYDLNGQKLKAGLDYDKAIKYTYHDDTGGHKAGSIVEKADIVPLGTVIDVEIVGMNNYKGKAYYSYKVTEKPFAKLKYQIKDKTYNGNVQTLSNDDIIVTINDKYSSETLEAGKDFELTGIYTNNINKGFATTYIKGCGDYSGYMKVKFRIKQLEALK